MKKVLLTSSGFETKVIEDVFLNLIKNAPQNAKVLFIPTAAIFPDAIAVLPKCMNDLLKVNIQKHNIKVFDLHRALTHDELSIYDAIYFTGGDPSYLIKRINDTGFNTPLKGYINDVGVYVGVSAGSLVATNNVPNNLGLLNCTLSVHMEHSNPTGVINETDSPHINLSANTAILINDGVSQIIE